MSILTVRLKPSKKLILILSLAHLSAASLLWLLVMPIVAKWVVFVLLFISLIFYIKQYALLQTDRAIVAFELSDEMRCKFETHAGELIVCTILGSSFVASYLVVLNLKPQNSFLTRSVVIFPDGIDSEIFRQLRVLLRWKWKTHH